jgi:hypothetical protein
MDELQLLEIESLQAIFDERLVCIEENKRYVISIQGECDDDNDSDDIVHVGYHIQQTGVYLTFEFTVGYPVTNTPVLVVNPLSCSSIIKLLESTGNDSSSYHKDLLQYLEFKKQILDNECLQLQKLLESQAKEMLSDEQPMIYSLINIAEDYLRNQENNNNELERLQTDYKLAQIATTINRPVKTARVMKLGLDDEVTVEHIPVRVDSPDDTLKNLQLKRGKQQLQMFDSPSDDSDKNDFKSMMKYAYKKSSKDKFQKITLAPYILFDKYVLRDTSIEPKLRRSLHSSTLTNFAHIPIIFGGITGSSASITNQLFALFMDNNSGSKTVKLNTGGSSPTPRVFNTLTCVSNDDTIYMIGGMAENGTVLSDIYKLRFFEGQGEKSRVTEKNLKSVYGMWEYVGALAGAVCGHSACVYKESVLVFGGYNGDAYKCTTQYVTNGESFLFNTYGSVPSARAGHSMSPVIDSCVFICGGHDDKRIFSDTYMLDLTTNSWTQIVTMGPSPSITHASNQMLIPQSSDSLMMYGGFDGKSWSDTLFEYSITEQKWKIICESSSTEDNKINTERLSNLAFPLCNLHKNNLVVTGGIQLQQQFKINNYKSILSAMAAEYQSINYSEVYKQPSLYYLRYQPYMDTAFESSLGLSLVEANSKWFTSQQEDGCDIVFEFLDEMEQPEHDDVTDKYKNQDIDAKIQPDEEGIYRLYCHKLIIQQSPKLAAIIAKNDFRHLLGTYSSDSMEFSSEEFQELQQQQQSNVVTIHTFKEKGLEHVNFRVFYKLIHYLYTGTLVIDKFLRSKSNLTKLLQLAKFLQLNLLVEMLSGSVSVSTLRRENLFIRLKELCTPLLEPKRLDPAELEIIKNQVALDQMMAQDEFDSGMIPPTTDEEQILKSDTAGIIKLIARNPYYNEEEDNGETDEFLFIEVHRGLLIRRSQYFKSMFDSSFSEATSGVVRIDQVNIEGIRCLCSYIYSSLLPPLIPSQVIEVYMATHQFVLEELQPWLRSIIRELIDINIACAICDISDVLDDTHMKKFCLHYIAKNLKNVELSQLSKQLIGEVHLIHNKYYSLHRN